MTTTDRPTRTADRRSADGRSADRRSFGRSALVAAVAAPVLALLATASPAVAQYRVNDGNARDANPKLGSGGRNEGGGGPGTTVNPNNVVYGTVTGGRYFRGPTASTDPRAFRGDTAGGVSDAFVRDSSGGYDRSQFSSSFNPQPFYGQGRAVAPPPSYVSPVTVTSGGYGGQAASFYYNRLSPGEIAARDRNVQGDVLAAGSTSPRAQLGTLGTSTTFLNGPADASGQPGSYMMLSPLSGPRQVTPDQMGEHFVIRGSERIPVGADTPGAQSAGPGANSVIGQIRQEITGSQPGSTAGAPNTTGTPNAGAAINSGITPAAGSPLGKTAGSAAGTSPGAGSNQPLIGPQSLGGTQPLQAGPGTGESTRRMLATPAQQSRQYSELQNRWKQIYGDRPLTDDEADRQFRDAQRVQNAGAGRVGGGNPATKPAGTAPGGTAPGGAEPAAPTVPFPPSEPTRRPEPLVVKSLATGVTSPTLAKVLGQAEDLMRAGKFKDALELYVQAETAAPNNPLVALGRGHAELGEASYRSAALDVRRALAADPALLVGKYDLKAMFPADRLAFIARDLTDLAAREPNDSTAPFLLAYLSYNTGEESKTAGYLDTVDKREGRPDPISRLMRRTWVLPGGLPPDANK
ncbi:MAG TPA: hypothetical protein VF796_02140 [Humisphaera sp.]